MSVKAPASRVRTPNFTRQDQELLTDVLKPYLHIIECKKTGIIKLSQKTEAWSKVCSAFNAKTNNVPRSKKNLINCYRNMKSKRTKQHSETGMNVRGKVEKASEKSCKNAFPALVEAKPELVELQLQTQLALMKIKHDIFFNESKLKQIKLEMQLQELQLEHRRKIHKLQLELEHMRRRHELELEDAIDEEFEDDIEEEFEEETWQRDLSDWIWFKKFSNLM